MCHEMDKINQQNAQKGYGTTQKSDEEHHSRRSRFLYFTGGIDVLVAIVLLILIPFLILCEDDFFWNLSFMYFLPFSILVRIYKLK